MHYSAALAAVVAIAPIVSGHGTGLPNIVGLDPKDTKARDLLSGIGARFTGVNEIASAKNKVKTQIIRRQDDRQCGAGIGNCPAGQCCSEAGYCGNDSDYCFSPGCDYKHGPACPENVTPAGTSTASIARTKIGGVQFGGDGIYSCTKPGTVALTYDDGPQKVFTSHILDVMASYNAKATFFITGNNIGKGQIDITPEFTQVIKRMDAEGHQIASHTWTHLDLSAISSQDRHDQMIKNEMALRNIVGKIPTYMRPPYSSCTAESGCEKDMADLGYHVTYFNLDTDDYEHDDPTLIQYAKDVFKGNVSSAKAANSQWLEIGHDIHEQTAMNLTEYMLSTLTQLGYKAVTVGECLGDPVDNWYRKAGGASTAKPTSASAKPTSASVKPTSAAPTPTGTKKVSTDATCGGTKGFTCTGSTFGKCCSSAGWCGSTNDYCGTGCQTGFGTCGNSAGSTTLSTAAAPKPTAAATKASTDGTCGGTSGFTCTGSTFGNCCSQYGWCGSTVAHCGTGCNTSFGKCT
ncbi:carbohydrate esterase family 4 protein [Bipolaris oryzae ATCC 44560]|uniref:Carbohydrate esterase family 4 protein n=1 Tax=Bipolaris oryzae ATCC 44560 TaxID=930090 RepID=W7A2W7_COCMI|nr:carbohydrate esterase family 4 protein [Bipolaris oryzae ATCC 44560]EUC50341.1 carbohydrate esterase family 4 protein [Bipolaris oryzae ATCC 44560]